MALFTVHYSPLNPKRPIEVNPGIQAPYLAYQTAIIRADSIKDARKKWKEIVAGRC